MAFPDYRTFKPKKKPVSELTEQELDHLIQEARRSLGERKSVDRAAQTGDEVKVGYSARNSENIVQMANPGADFVLGTGSLFPEFEAALVGHKKGDKVTVSCQVPEDHFLRTLRGQKLDFEAELLDVKELTLPTEDDTLALKMLGEGKTLNDLKAVLRQELIFRKEERAKDALAEEFFDGLFEALKDSVSEKDIVSELGILIEAAYRKAESEGMSREEYDKRLDEGKLNLQIQLRNQAHRNVALRFALDEIFKNPEFQLEENQLLSIFENEIKNLPEEEKTKVREALKANPKFIEELRRRVQMDKLFQFIEE